MPLIRIVYWGILLVILLWILFWDYNSYLSRYQKARKLQRMKSELVEMVARNDSLRNEILELQSNPEAAEKVGRERYGLIKPNEKIFRFVPAPESPKDK
ncbi:MAG: septum formation initiator family protein [Candidatus Cloacimonetes bacterium]|nr:septum formation initiator family protein [Candidatus Cloacimonadota bacterium]